MNHGHKTKSAEILVRVGGENNEIAIIKWERVTNLVAKKKYQVTVDYGPSYLGIGSLRSNYDSSAAIDHMSAKRFLNKHLKRIQKDFSHEKIRPKFPTEKLSALPEGTRIIALCN